ncbi:hypothetical protein SAMN05192575_101910 [Nocardioides alpinus]|uniref:Uncharacterized protein n=1 Tax=Nocardioides alpinus TaxID=748909 RepID=A0A1I0WCV1_9ACTN|nr:hypothetical protein [Nocardioides alpinus]PKH37849.1 hypothetical protein CXG46_20885 [Nocardioides alpinus]SFA86585.1 hypothetical protein SAMN05192575_101910 [Nocardioides alpinus]
MSGRKDLDDMSPEEIGAWAARDWAEGLAANADRPKPEISRVKRDDYPHWDVVAYEFHTRAGDRVLVRTAEGTQVEGTLGGVRTARGQDELLVELDRTVWACTRADGQSWAPKDNGRVRVETLEVAVRARRVEGAPDAQEWTLQTNMEGQP